MTIQRTKLSAAACAVAAAIVAGALGAWPHAAAEGSAASGTRSSGQGEALVLVIADVVDMARTDAALASTNARFGDLQGFYAAPTDDYDVTAIYLQTSPDLTKVVCESEGLFTTLVGGDVTDIECPEAQAVKVLAPIDLAHVPTDAFNTLTFPACGKVGLPPCQEQRINELLDDDLQLPAGRAALVTGFRTKRGAQEFLELARTFGVDGLIAVQVLNSGTADIGLGQEPHPDGTGPLQASLPDQEAFQH